MVNAASLHSSLGGAARPRACNAVCLGAPARAEGWGPGSGRRQFPRKQQVEQKHGERTAFELKTTAQCYEVTMRRMKCWHCYPQLVAGRAPLLGLPQLRVARCSNGAY
jgi:hypothetical protein